MPYKTRAQKQSAQEKRLAQVSTIDYPQNFTPAPKEPESPKTAYVSSPAPTQSETVAIVKDLRKVVLVSAAILIAQTALYLTL